MDTTADTAYDTVLYPSACWPHTHPDHLATLATIFGMKPASARQARTLEVGCGNGWNLIPLAHAFPEANFVGVDLAPSTIQKATSDAQALGLTNVEFHAVDLLDWAPPDEKFDYVIAHGFFSWVPEPVRLRLLELCRDRLAPHGVVYISYNALPGCHLRQMLREMMRYHVRGVDEPAAKIAKAREFLHLFMAGRMSDTKLSALLREEAQRALDRHETVLYHDDLATINQPYYFHEFVELADWHGLQFLAEATYTDMLDFAFPNEVVSGLRPADANVAAKQQYLDFLMCRRFRQTLLCRADAQLNRTPAPDIVRQLLIASRAKPKSPSPSMAAGAPEEFSTARTNVRVGDALAKAVLAELAVHWPRAFTFDELMAAAHRRLGWPMSDAASREGPLTQIVFSGFANGLVELQSHQPAWDVKKGKRPLLSPITRFQIVHNMELLTSLRGASNRMDPLVRRVFLLMDGTRNNTAITNELRRLGDAGELKLPEFGNRQQLASEVDRIVRDAAATGMLIAWDDSTS